MSIRMKLFFIALIIAGIIFAYMTRENMYTQRYVPDEPWAIPVKVVP